MGECLFVRSLFPANLDSTTYKLPPTLTEICANPALWRFMRLHKRRAEQFLFQFQFCLRRQPAGTCWYSISRASVPSQLRLSPQHRSSLQAALSAHLLRRRPAQNRLLPIASHLSHFRLRWLICAAFLSANTVCAVPSPPPLHRAAHSDGPGT